MKDYVSPSQINSFSGCSMKWAYGYDIDPSTITKDVLGINPNLSLGNCLHDYAKEFSITQDLQMKDVDFLTKRIERCVKVDKKIDVTQFKIIAETFLKHYLDAYIFNTGNTEIAINGFIGKIKIFGYVDKVLDDEIVDLKIKGTLQKDKDCVIIMNYDEFVQLGLYCIFTGRKKASLNIVHVNRRKKSDFISFHKVSRCYTEKDFSLIQARAKVMWALMKQKVYYPNRNYIFCSPKFCNFWTQCHKDFG